MGLDPHHPSEYIDFVYIGKKPTDDRFRSKSSLLAVLHSLGLRQDEKRNNNNNNNSCWNIGHVVACL
jgi:hypothetical protein